MHHCRALAGEIEYSCAMCWEIGIDCWATKSPENPDNPAAERKFFPLFDFSRVGLGNLCTFSKCTRCKETGRNCDRQRPCDSCVEDAAAHTGSGSGSGSGSGPGSCCDDVKDGYNCIKRLSYPPGPIYYLALGYGPNGVHDVKDGSKMEHWIGPPFPLYAIDKKPPTEAQKKSISEEKKKKMAQLTQHVRDANAAIKADDGDDDDVAGDASAAAANPADQDKKPARKPASKAPPKTENKMTLTSIAQEMRRVLLPPGKPPLGTDPLPIIGGGAGPPLRVQDKLISQLSAEELAAIISAKWQGGPERAFPPNRHPRYDEIIWQGRKAVEELRTGSAA
ncbi:hypothetical protein E4U41_005416, partial [Claviceps citrina]